MRDDANDGAPWATCVMIFLDGQRFIDDAIRSVVEQAAAPDWELVLVDDGSTDGSTEIARRWAATDPRIRYVDHPGHVNLGMSASRNAGVAAAQGRFVGFLDSDDVWLPDRLAHAHHISGAHPDADVVIGASWRWHGWTGDPTDLAQDHRHALPPVPTGVVLAPPALFGAMYADPPWWNELAMCGFLVRRDVLLELGGFEAEYRGLFEDQVLYVKLALGTRVVVDPHPVAKYRQHDGSTCARAIARGDWSPMGDSPPLRRFVAWMVEYVTAHSDPGSPEVAVALANRDFDWASLGRPVRPAGWRRLVPPAVRRRGRRLLDVARGRS